MEKITLTIPNMKSMHCQMTVKTAVNAMGASVKSTVPANAVIELPKGITREDVIQTIEKAGYKVINEIL